MALYLIPLQIFVFTRLHQITQDRLLRDYNVLGIVGYYPLVQTVRLFFATHARTWLPYQLV